MRRGMCLGYAIESDVEFRFLRAGGSGEVLAVREWEPPAQPSGGGELLVRWRQRPDRPFHGEVHRLGDGRLAVATSDAGWFRIDTENRCIEVPVGVDSIAREVRLWTTPMLLLSTLAGFTPLHAACVEIQGRAVAIAAPGGFGKTTLAAELVGRGHGLVAEDITVCDGTEQLVLPGPDLLRLRPPSIGHVTLPETAEVAARTEDRLFVRTGSPDVKPAPLEALVLLKEGDDVEMTERVDAGRLADLWQVSFHLPNMEDRRRSFAAVAALADSIPIFDLIRPMDWQAFHRSADAIEHMVTR